MKALEQKILDNGKFVTGVRISPKGNVINLEIDESKRFQTVREALEGLEFLESDYRFYRADHCNDTIYSIKFKRHSK